MKIKAMPGGFSNATSPNISPDDVLIRRAAFDDIALIQNMARIIWADTHAGLMCEKAQARVLEQSYSQENLMKSIRGNVFLLGEVCGVAAGYVDMGRQNEVLYLHRLYVMPQFQRRSLGQLLLEEAISQSISLFPGNLGETSSAGPMEETFCSEMRKTSPAPMVVVATVEESNSKARSFYSKMGFIEESSTAITMGGVEIPAVYIVMCLP